MFYRKTKGTFIIAAVLFALLVIFPKGVSAAEKGVSLSLNKSSISLYSGTSTTLKAAVKGTSSSVKWSSSNPGIAAVTKSGKVRAKKAGKAAITVSVGKKKARCTVVVKKLTDIAKYYGKSKKTIKKAFPGGKARSRDYEDEYVWKGIVFWFQNDRFIGVFIRKNVKGITLGGVRLGMNSKTAVSKLRQNGWKDSYISSDHVDMYSKKYKVWFFASLEGGKITDVSLDQP